VEDVTMDPVATDVTERSAPKLEPPPAPKLAPPQPKTSSLPKAFANKMPQVINARRAPLYRGSAGGGFAGAADASSSTGGQDTSSTPDGWQEPTSMVDDGWQEPTSTAAAWGDKAWHDTASWHTGWSSAHHWLERGASSMEVGYDPCSAQPNEPPGTGHAAPAPQGKRGQEGHYVDGGFVTSDGVFHAYLRLDVSLVF